VDQRQGGGGGGVRAWRREEKGRGETFSLVATGVLYSQSGGIEGKGEGGLRLWQHHVAGGVGMTPVWRRRATVDTMLPLDLETEEGWDTDTWDLHTVTGGGGLF
jgi:hypothetical protein